MPTPPRQPPTGPDVKPLEHLEAFGTIAQRSYYKRRVRKDVLAVLDDLQAARRKFEPAPLSADNAAYIALLHDLAAHVPHLLNATCTMQTQWRRLEAQIPQEEDDNAQASLPLPLRA